MTDFNLRRGDKAKLLIKCRPPASDPTWTLAQCPTLTFTAKPTLDGDDSTAVFRKSLSAGIVVDGALAAHINIVKGDWPAYDATPPILYWDLEGRDAQGEPTTLDSGAITVRFDATRSAP